MKYLFAMIVFSIAGLALAEGKCKSINAYGEITQVTASYDVCRRCSSYNNYCGGWSNGIPIGNSTEVTTYYISRDEDMVITTIFKDNQFQKREVAVRP